MKKAVLIDVDGTLVSLTEFDYSIFNASKEEVDSYLKVWDERTMDAVVYEKGVEMLIEFKEMGYALVVVTARGQNCKKYTMKKFKEMGIDKLIDSVWHRPKVWEGRPSALYKEWMIKKLSKKWAFEWAMEDEEKNMEVMKKAGMKVLDAKVWW